jgi:hypothetical protein
MLGEAYNLLAKVEIQYDESTYKRNSHFQVRVVKGESCGHGSQFTMRI